MNYNKNSNNFHTLKELKSYFYNTIGITGDALKKAQRQVKTQEEKILFYFLKNPDKIATPIRVLIECEHLYNIPVTSVRRALTNLTKMGYLEKTDIKKKGIYGKLNYCWKLKTL